jgi:3-hydroxyacyl-[acyl-carrier-protein] dehydratase
MLEARWVRLLFTMVDRDATPTCQHPAGSAASPLRAVDSVEQVTLEPGTLALRATKTVKAADPYMAGHFPGHTIYPGVFILESVVQAAAAALATPVRIACVRSVRFTAPLHDADVLTVDCAVRALQSSRAWLLEACCQRQDGVLCARVRLVVEAEGHSDARLP